MNQTNQPDHQDRGIHDYGTSCDAYYKGRYLGTFPTRDEAKQARQRAYERDRNLRLYGNPDVIVVRREDAVPTDTAATDTNTEGGAR